MRPRATAQLAFYESTLSLGGLQLSASPGKDGAMAAEFEKDLPSEVYYHPANTPAPPMAGMLTVPASELTWDRAAGQWELSDVTFQPAGAMHLANELNWFGPHLGAVPFPFAQDNGATSPDEPATASGDSTATGEPVVFELRARNIAFDVTDLTVPAGRQITITFDNADDGVAHNLHIQGVAGGPKTEIAAGPVVQELTFTIDEPGTFTFVCDVHPNQMVGTLTVTK